MLCLNTQLITIVPDTPLLDWLNQFFIVIQDICMILRLRGLVSRQTIYTWPSVGLVFPIRKLCHTCVGLATCMLSRKGDNLVVIRHGGALSWVSVSFPRSVTSCQLLLLLNFLLQYKLWLRNFTNKLLFITASTTLCKRRHITFWCVRLFSETP